MRCYFHLVSRHETISDDTGLEVSDLEAVQYHPRQAIHELRRAVDHIGQEWQDWRLDVADPSGRVLLSFPFDTSLQ
jgi:Domain of unknown function (DUF6894)